MLTGQQLTQLQQAQAKLDAMIFAHHATNRKQTYDQRRLALIVELAELANVERTFKYWCRPRPCDRSRLIEEYVDALHFLLSISLDFKINFFNGSPAMKHPLRTNQPTPVLFLDLFALCQQLFAGANVADFWRLFRLFFRLGFCLQLPSAAVWQAYWAKHQINHQRQLALY